MKILNSLKKSKLLIYQPRNQKVKIVKKLFSISLLVGLLAIPLGVNTGRGGETSSFEKTLPYTLPRLIDGITEFYAICSMGSTRPTEIELAAIASIMGKVQFVPTSASLALKYSDFNLDNPHPITLATTPLNILCRFIALPIYTLFKERDKYYNATAIATANKTSQRDFSAAKQDQFVRLMGYYLFAPLIHIITQHAADSKSINQGTRGLIDCVTTLAATLFEFDRRARRYEFELGVLDEDSEEILASADAPRTAIS